MIAFHFILNSVIVTDLIGIGWVGIEGLVPKIFGISLHYSLLIIISKKLLLLYKFLSMLKFKKK